MDYTLRFERIIKSQELVLIFFYQIDCRECETMRTILKVVQQRLENQLPIIKLNIELYPQIAQTYRLNQYPVSLLFFKKKLRFQQVGIIPSKKIIALFNQYN